MTRLIAPLLLALALLAGGAGCVTKPTAHIQNAVVRGASPQGLGVQMYLRVKNDNSFDIQVRRVRGRAIINGRWSMPVDLALYHWLPSDSSTVMVVPMWIPWAMLPAIAFESFMPQVAFRLTGTADVTATRLFGVEKDDFPIDETGVVPRDVLTRAARGVIPW